MVKNLVQNSRFLKKEIKKNQKSLSSRRWIERQINDPFVLAAAEQKYRSRSAFKLLELNEKFNIFKNGDIALDLGAYPGGWSQVLAEKIIGGKIVAIDIKEMDSLEGVSFIKEDLFEKQAQKKIKRLISFANVVLSDMAPSATGHKSTDQIRSQNLADCALDIADLFLKNRGNFCCKIIGGGETDNFIKKLKKKFKTVKVFKPISSRKESAEIFLVGLNYRQGIVE